MVWLSQPKHASLAPVRDSDQPSNNLADDFTTDRPGLTFQPHDPEPDVASGEIESRLCIASSHKFEDLLINRGRPRLTMRDQPARQVMKNPSNTSKAVVQGAIGFMIPNQAGSCINMSHGSIDVAVFRCGVVKVSVKQARSDTAGGQAS